MTKAAAVEEALGHEVFEVGLEVLTVEGKAKGARGIVGSDAVRVFGRDDGQDLINGGGGCGCGERVRMGRHGVACLSPRGLRDQMCLLLYATSYGALCPVPALLDAASPREAAPGGTRDGGAGTGCERDIMT